MRSKHLLLQGAKRCLPSNSLISFNSPLHSSPAQPPASHCQPTTLGMGVSANLHKLGCLWSSSCDLREIQALMLNRPWGVETVPWPALLPPLLLFSPTQKRDQQVLTLIRFQYRTWCQSTPLPGTPMSLIVARLELLPWLDFCCVLLSFMWRKILDHFEMGRGRQETLQPSSLLPWLRTPVIPSFLLSLTPLMNWG